MDTPKGWDSYRQVDGWPEDRLKDRWTDTSKAKYIFIPPMPGGRLEILHNEELHNLYASPSIN
jgi:hypothetical protein